MGPNETPGHGPRCGSDGPRDQGPTETIRRGEHLPPYGNSPASQRRTDSALLENDHGHIPPCPHGVTVGTLDGWLFGAPLLRKLADGGWRWLESGYGKAHGPRTASSRPMRPTRLHEAYLAECHAHEGGCPAVLPQVSGPTGVTAPICCATCSR